LRESLNRFYYLFNRDLDYEGVWYVFRLPYHSSGLIVKIYYDGFYIELGQSRKYWLGKPKGFKISFLNRLTKGKNRSVAAYRRFLESHNIKLRGDVVIKWPFGNLPYNDSTEK
jgi:hypothetical protein